MTCTAPPTAEHDAHLTADIMTFTDPPGVAGSGAGSGGTLKSTGAAVYPQMTPAPGSVDVAMVSCTLTKVDRSLCPEIEEDFLVRNPPAYAGATGG